MSYILDALRKAERERSLGQAPSLNTQYAVAEAPRRRVPAWLAPAVIGVLGLTVALIYGLRPRDRAENEAPETEIAEVSVVPAAAEPEPAPPSAPAVQTVTVQTEEGPLQAEIPATPSAEAPPEPIAPGPDSAPPAQAAAVTPLTEPVPPSEPVEPPLEELPAGEPPEEAIGPDTPEAPDPGDPDAIVPRARARLDIPSYDGLPDSIRSGIPSLSMKAHVFSSTPGRGFVMMNGRKYREGDVLNEGPEVVEILPEGAVLRYRGTDFLFPVPR